MTKEIKTKNFGKYTDESESKQLAISFLGCAEIDLVSSRCLFIFGHYSSSIYHLQQAVEKTLKSILFWDGKDTRGLSHKTMMACVRVLDLDKILHKHFTPEVVNKIEKIINFENCPSDMEVCARKTYDEISGNILELLKQKSSLEQTISNEKLPQLTEEEKEAMSAFLSWGLAIAIMAYYLAPHEAFTRYPDGKLTPLDYQPDKLGIVRIAPDFCDILHGIIIMQYQTYGLAPILLV
jgi:hypothetical protein